MRKGSYGVLTPVRWLFNQLQTLIGSTVVTQMIRSPWGMVRDRLRGGRGLHSQGVAWALIGCLGLIAISTVWYGTLGIPQMLSRRKVVYFTSGVTNLAKEKYNEAIADLVQAIEIDPKYTEAIEKLAEAHLSRGDDSKAAQQFEQAIDDYHHAFRLNANVHLSLQACMKLGWLRAKCRDANSCNGPDAVHWARTAIALAGETNPEARELLAAAYNRCGEEYLTKNEYSVAIDHFREALNIDRASENAPNNLAVARRLLADVYSRRGDACSARGEYSVAIDHYNEAIRIDPNNPDAPKKRDQAVRIARGSTITSVRNS